MSPRDAKELLLQFDVIEEILPRIGKEQWQSLYSHSHVGQRELTIWGSSAESVGRIEVLLKEVWVG